MTHCPLFSFKTMETCEDGNDLVFFYQVCEGVASASHASHTAAQAGLPDKLIARGKEVIRSRVQPPPSQGSLPLSLFLLETWASGLTVFLTLVFSSLSLTHHTPYNFHIIPRYLI